MTFHQDTRHAPGWQRVQTDVYRGSCCIGRECSCVELPVNCRREISPRKAPGPSSVRWVSCGVSAPPTLGVHGGSSVTARLRVPPTSNWAMFLPQHASPLPASHVLHHHPHLPPLHNHTHVLPTPTQSHLIHTHPPTLCSQTSPAERHTGQAQVRPGQRYLECQHLNYAALNEDEPREQLAFMGEHLVLKGA